MRNKRRKGVEKDRGRKEGRENEEEKGRRGSNDGWVV